MKLGTNNTHWLRIPEQYIVLFVRPASIVPLYITETLYLSLSDTSDVAAVYVIDYGPIQHRHSLFHHTSINAGWPGFSYGCVAGLERVTRWRSGRASDLWPSGHGFDSRSGRYRAPRSTLPSIPPGSVKRVPAFSARVKAECARLCRAASTIVWHHTLVTPRSSEMACPWRTYSALTFLKLTTDIRQIVVDVSGL